MYGIKVELVAETASFRDPGGQLYHVCLPLPPVSTIIGIAGAALGLTFEQVWNWFRDHQMYVGVSGVAVGKGKDLWSYTKRTIDLEKQPRTDIVNREFLCFAKRSLTENEGTVVNLSSPIKLFYAGEQREALLRLLDAFQAPAFALTLGTSDELAKCVSVTWYESIEIVETDELQNVMVEGDWSNQFTFDWEAIREMPLRVTLTAPTVKRLPVDYTFESSGVRKGSRYQSFTFLTDLQRLKNPVVAYQFAQEQVPLVSISTETENKSCERTRDS